MRALLPSPTGSVVFAGGFFTHVNGASTAHLAALDPSSGAMHHWRSHTGDSILSLAENGSYLYAGDKGGGGHVRSFVLRTGRLRWTETTDGNVNAVALVGRGSAQQLVIGGHFTKVGAQERHKVAVLSPQSGLVDTSAGSWHPAAAGSDLGIYGMLAYGQKVYFGGDFLEWQTHPGVERAGPPGRVQHHRPGRHGRAGREGPGRDHRKRRHPRYGQGAPQRLMVGDRPGQRCVPLPRAAALQHQPLPAAGPPARDVAERLDCGLAGDAAPTPLRPLRPTAPTTPRRSRPEPRSGSPPTRTRARPSRIAAAGPARAHGTRSEGRCAAPA